jgi:translation initiation factor 2 subunit 3
VGKKQNGRQAEINIGTAGHVDHGKTTLIQALTGSWAAKHSEELRRGITIKVGYADTAIYKCLNCPPPECYTVKEECPKCGGPAKLQRIVSFVDCPGHEVLMTTMLSGTAIMDGAILVVAADEKVPQPQTREHLAALGVIGVEKIILVQNKIELVPKDRVLENYKQIIGFIKGTIAEDAPVIPISALHGTNIDVLLETIETKMPTPKRDLSKPPRMHVVRSFDVNRPGIPAEKLLGGVLGGTLQQGVFREGDELEVKPGIRIETKGRTEYRPLFSKIETLHAGGRRVEEATCGGLVGIGTQLDPSLTKADGLVGNTVGKPGTLPPVTEQLQLETHLFEQAIGTKEMAKVEKIRIREPLVLNGGTAVTLGTVVGTKGEMVEFDLRRPICIDPSNRIAISRRMEDRWRLIGYGVVK